MNSGSVWPLFSCPSCKILLFVLWAFGLISGIAFSYCTQAFSSLMHGALEGTVSIVGLGTVLLLPYLLTAAAVWMNQPLILILPVFVKAFAFGACSAAADLAFADAGWLIRMLLLFSDGASLPVLFWLWLRCLDDSGERLSRCFIISMGFLLLIGSIDYLVIAPFLASVI